MNIVGQFDPVVHSVQRAGFHNNSGKLLDEKRHPVRSLHNMGDEVGG